MSQNQDADVDDISENELEQETLPQAESGGNHDLAIPSDGVVDAEGNASLGGYMRKSYMEYAVSVVKGRALPDVRDGQKPVHRRILYSMDKMGLDSTGKHVKSARVVGDVIGKYHPHGDQSVYDAAVRASQEFTLRYPLIDGQGNFGSRDGDGAAAMRYTEMRLTPIAQMMMEELDKGTVDFIDNYDGNFQEPSVLPARLPMILMNGASGIAVGMATEIPSHNLRETVAATLLLMEKPEATLDDVLAVLPAPDFPGGGQIISSPSALRDIYVSGRGSLRMRALWKKEELARGQWRIVVYEHVHGSSTAKVLEDIDAASNPQPKVGKKDVTQEQKNTKALILSVLDAARDESNKDEPVRLVLEPKTSKISPNELMDALFGLTRLEDSVPVNMTMIGLDGNPQQKGLVTVLKEWIEFRCMVVDRRIRHRLEQVMNRLHILEGRLAAFLRIEEVIRIIRESDAPKEALMEKIGLSEIQAEDILEIRLRQLARLEGIKIQEEADELHKEAAKLRGLLSDRASFDAQIMKELRDDAKKFGDDRRTLVQPIESVVARAKTVPDEPVTVLLSANGWLRARQGHGIDRSTLAWKPGDSEGLIIETRSVHPLIVLDNEGCSYAIDVADIPQGRGDGVPLTSMVQFTDGKKFAHAFSDSPSASYLFANSGSYGFISQVNNLMTRQKAGKRFMTIEAGETVLKPMKVTDMNLCLATFSEGEKEARMLLFPLNEMKILPKGRGVIVMGLGSGERLGHMAILPSAKPETVSVQTSMGQRIDHKGADLEKFFGHRARKGCQMTKKGRVTSIL